MDRRLFLQLTGSACAAAAGGRASTGAEKVAASPRLEPSLLRLGPLSDRNQNRSTVACRHGIVCASQPLASMAGVDVLKAGGNAVDAAIAANAMLSLVEPMSCGPGGDLFAILWSEKDRRLFGMNASGRAPYDWSLKDAQGLGLKEIPAYSPLSVERARPASADGKPWRSDSASWDSSGFSNRRSPARTRVFQ